MPRHALGALACLLVITSCSTSGTPIAGESITAPTTTSSSTAAPTTTSPPPTTPASRQASPEAAADGTDYAACADGDCEVFVDGKVTIPLDPKFGFTTFQVTCADETTTVFGGDPAQGNLRSSIGGTGVLNANGITMTVTSSDPTGAILRFTPR